MEDIDDKISQKTSKENLKSSQDKKHAKKQKWSPADGVSLKMNNAKIEKYHSTDCDKHHPNRSKEMKRSFAITCEKKHGQDIRQVFP